MTAHDVDASSAGEPRRPNPEAIAWYVEEAQRLLEDQQRRAESLRTRGGQIAGFAGANLILIGGSVTGLPGELEGAVRAIVGITLAIAVLALAATVAVAIWGALRPGALAVFSKEEIAIYTSERFLVEPDLWRVHLRALQALSDAVAEAQEAGDAAAAAIEVSLLTFLTGFALSLAAVGTLLLEFI